ncbi:MAG: DUF1549 domain-containing protein [Pirellulales bacterium]
MNRSPVFSLGIALFFAIVVSFEKQTTAQMPQEHFRRLVVPLLEKKCYSCHSHQSGTMEGGLALDWRSGWERGGSRGPAILAGDAASSLLAKAIRHESNELKMPEEKLTSQEIHILEEWIRNGAYDDRVAQPSPRDPYDWWSLRPLPEASDMTTKEWSIDHWIEASLDREGLRLSSEADRRTWLRRVYYDLIGLPPTYEEVVAFEQRSDPQAKEEVVDRLLNSPRYGERWARHWLDTIHFADSHGYEHDIGRDHAWPYRDWVIQALNGDKPWRDWIIEQLATDAVHPDQSSNLPALGFLGAGTFDLSTFSTAPVTFDYLDRDDLVTQTLAAFCSTTANCARCHAHKFDPISQEDYYALQAVFSGILKGDIAYDDDLEIAKRRLQWSRLQNDAKSKKKDSLQSPEVLSLIAKWLETNDVVTSWQILVPDTFISTEGATLTKLNDGGLLASGASPEKDTYVLHVSKLGSPLTAIRLDVLPDASLPSGGPGRCSNGNLHLSEIEFTLFEPTKPEGRRLSVARALSDFDQAGWGIERAIDGNLTTAWGIHPEVAKPHHAIFVLRDPLEVPAGSYLVITLRQLHGGSHCIGSMKLSATKESAERIAAIPESIAKMLDAYRVAKTESTVMPSIPQELAAFILDGIASRELAKLPSQKRVYAAAAKVEIPSGEGQYQSKSIETPKAVHVLQRGEFDKPQQEVLPGSLSIWPQLRPRFATLKDTPESSRRLALAEWIAHRDNGLTWRSIVNRVWQYHFGRGLCDTPSDFGRMGGVPSHPELIDHLAVWFRDEARGSLKALHRKIILSRVYAQSSQSNAMAAAKDSENRWLWRQYRPRLDADAFRDYVHAVSGNLDLTMGGPAIQHFRLSKGPQSTPALDYQSFDWKRPEAHRRSIYRYVWRGIADPFMESLDFPDLGLLSPTRSFSASPLQALSMMHNDFVMYQSTVFAENAEVRFANLESRIQFLVQRCWQRDPTAEEMIKAY